MASPQAYKRKLAKLDPNCVNFQLTTVSDAQKAIVKIEKIEAFLNALVEQTNSEVQRVESKYKQARKASSITLLDTLLKRNGEKALQAKQLDTMRQELVTKYAKIQLITTKFLQSYDSKKQTLLDFIEHELG